MSSTEPNHTSNQEDEAFVCAMQLSLSHIVPVVLDAAIQLGLLDIIAENGKISPSKLASHLPTKNKDAPTMLDTMLRLLATQSIVTCSLSNSECSGREVERFYQLTSIGEFFVRGTPNSLTSFFLFNNDQEFHKYRHHLKDAILDGGSAFEKAYGMSPYQYHIANPNYTKILGKAMGEQSNILMTKILKIYKGFEGIKSLVDVGGGIGTTLHSIISVYPSIKGINFDLPHVIKNDPTPNGIKHIGGDMLVSIPNGEAILLKWICHNWDDEHCVKLFKNCYEALPENGKVILIENMIPPEPNTSNADKVISQLDSIMLSVYGSKERTINQFEALSKAAGFTKIQLKCLAYATSIVEIFK